MKKKLSVRAAVSLLLSALLFCMPVGAFMANSGNTVDAYAEGALTEESGEASAEGSTEGETEESAETGENSEDGEDETGGTESESGSNEEETESGTVSGNEVPEPECTCKEKCTQYSIDKDCEVCKGDYSLCEYVNPNVKITISTPSGWHNDTTKVHISIEDVAHSGNFTIKTVQAKVAQNGSWTDITEDMYVEISENTTVYVLVTDQRGKTYEKNRYIKCFDFTKPTLNAAVSDGLLSIQAHDTDSGIKAVYVNGYEFTELTNGVLNIRLQQFDAGYQYFTISAMDNAGNMSEIYKTANPYYTDPENSEKNPAEQLPVNAQATKPSSATAQVTEHTMTDSEGNTVSENSLAEQKKQAMAEAAASEGKEESGEKEKSETGKEFYTIQTASEKVFYLIIDRDGEEEMVYFLTEVTENDLLNVTADNSETLPKNSAALESAIPVTEGALPNNNGETEKEEEPTEESAEDGEEENTEEPEPEPEKTGENPMATYAILGIVAVAAIGGGYYFKVVRKKKEEFLDEDDDEDDEEEEYEDDGENEDNEDDFFEDKEGEDE